jgi:zinc protease
MKYFSLLSTVLILALTAHAARAEEQASLVKALQLKLRTAERYSLANGLSVVLEEDHRLPRVAVHVSYRVGALDDPPGYASLAHLVEHLTFRGSRHVPAPGSLALYKRLGATTTQGTTGLLETSYFFVLPAEQLENALWIESDRMAFALEKIDGPTLELERAIVSQELRLRQRTTQPYSDHVMRALFPAGHAYHPQASELEDLKTIQLRHVQRFMQEFYRPDNATLVIVGDFNAAHTKALVAQYFGPIVPPRIPLRRAVPTRIELSGLKRLVVGTPGPAELMTFVWLAPRVTGSDYRSLTLAVDLLVKRLHRRLVETTALASGVSWNVHPMKPHVIAGIEVALGSESDPYQIEDAVAVELARLHARPIRDLELTLLRGQHATNKVSALESLEYRALAATNDIPFDAPRELRDLGAVSPNTVLDAARRYLSRERRLVAYFRSDPLAAIGGAVMNEEEVQ